MDLLGDSSGILFWASVEKVIWIIFLVHPQKVLDKSLIILLHCKNKIYSTSLFAQESSPTDSMALGLGV